MEKDTVGERVQVLMDIVDLLMAVGLYSMARCRYDKLVDEEEKLSFDEANTVGSWAQDTHNALTERLG